MNIFKRLRKSSGKLLALVSFLLAFQGIIGASSANASCLTNAQIASITSGSGTYVTCGGDDIAYRIPISGTVVFGGVTYSDVFATTNSVITFGTPDVEYSQFPGTPSISLDSTDWVVDGYFGDGGLDPSYTGLNRTDEFLNISVSGNTFIVDISARLYATYSNGSSSGGGTFNYVPQGNATRLLYGFTRGADGTLRINLYSSDQSDTSLRNGCVLTPGATAISFAECGILEAASPEAIVQEVVKVNSLAVTSPLVISQTKEAVICTGAGLNYMVQGVQAVTPTLTTQTFSLSVDGVVVAHKQTLDSSASFDKRLLPTSGVATCSQEATQGGSQVTIRSEVSGALAEAEKSRQIAVAKIKSDFKIHSQSLNSSKPEKSSFESAVAYYAASKEWRSGLLAAQKERDTAIRAAQIIEMDTAYTIGMKVDLRP